MKRSSNDSKTEGSDALRETPPAYDFELPVEPGYRERPPCGTVEAGIRLGLIALRQIEGRPGVFEERERHRCDVEFKL